MNTDNTAISGETIDYGPCAFMDLYHPNTVFSSIDHHGRYAYGNQPHIMKWNMARFAETLLPLLDHDQQKAVAIATELLETFDAEFESRWLAMMRKKLGLYGDEACDLALATDLFSWMVEAKIDYTNTFNALRSGNLSAEPKFQEDPFKQWHEKWRKRRQLHAPSPDASSKLMAAHNPVYIPRNHLVEEALDKAAHSDDLGPFHSLLAVVTKPYEQQHGQNRYQSPPTPGQRVHQTFCGT